MPDDDPPRDRARVLVARARRRLRKVGDRAVADCLAEILDALELIAGRTSEPETNEDG